MTLDHSEQKTVDDIAKHGWHCIHVGEGNGEPNFSYSVGWWENAASPEAIIFGLPRKLQHSMLWEVFRQIRAGKKFVDGSKWANLIEGHECIARLVHETQLREYFGLAIWYRHFKTNSVAGLTAYQIFWPSKEQGIFPWQSGCHQSVRDCQPLLYLPRSVGNA